LSLQANEPIGLLDRTPNSTVPQAAFTYEALLQRVIFGEGSLARAAEEETETRRPPMPANWVLSLPDLQDDDVERCGGKAASLGKLVRMGAAVPPGFCILAEALDETVAANNLAAPIAAIAANLNFEDFAAVEKSTGDIRDMIAGATIPAALSDAIAAHYRALVTADNRYVAVRSSVAVRGTAISSFPGMMDTYHFIVGEEDVIAKVRECWASLWSSRAAHLRHHKRIPHDKGIIAPIVQLMVNSDTAGVLFTANPVTKDRGEMIIEANWGLGESVVSGRSMNDYFVLDKASLATRQRKIAKKTLMVVMDDSRGSGRIELPVPSDRSTLPTLSDAQLVELGGLGKMIESHYGFSVDIEWAYQDLHLYILQARKIRDLGE
jgi:pyruvate,water dikinase